ncbi:unnamed protein product [marine sediment metagenome]|uniref:Uncharacterized protein n=1 Tax=marine sediment metagenome TaxID=412755 RepID=X0XZ06_9ZZZZ
MRMNKKKEILVLCGYQDLESMYLIKAFGNRRLLNKYLKDNNIEINRDDIGKGHEVNKIELVVK